MANQEVVNAINETIVPNGVKAINADSVRNLLLLMAENMGEGGGSGSGNGAVKVHVAIDENLDFSEVDFDNVEDIEPFTPEEFEIIKSMYLKVQQDNIAAYKLLNEHREHGISDLVMGDYSFFTTLLFTATIRMYDDFINQMDPDLNVDWSSVSFNIAIGIPLVYASIDTDTSGLDENSLKILEEFFGAESDIPLNGIHLSDPSDEYGTYTLMADGSVLYENSQTEEEPYERIIYVSGGVELTEDQIEVNKKAYDKLPVQSSFVEYWQIREMYDTGYISQGGYVHEAYKFTDTTTSQRCSYGRFWKGKDMWEVRVYEDGTATLEIYASINPTE